MLGWLFGRAGWEVVFVDVAPGLVDLLNRRRSYRVIVVGDAGRSSELIEGVSGVDGTDTEPATSGHCLGRIGVYRRGTRDPRKGGTYDRGRAPSERQPDPQCPGLRERRPQHGAAETACGDPDRRGARGGFPGDPRRRMVPGSASDDLSVEVGSTLRVQGGRRRLDRAPPRGSRPGTGGRSGPAPDEKAVAGQRTARRVGIPRSAAGHETIAQAVSDPASGPAWRRCS